MIYNDSSAKDDAHTIGENAATRYSSAERMNNMTVVISSPIIPNRRASGPRNVLASTPALDITCATESST